MPEAFIYMWTNTVNGKKYIGSHIGHIEDGYTGSGIAFKRALSKYGMDSFERTILEYVESKKDVLIREQYYIDLYNAANDKQFYNMRSKAGGGFEYVNSLPWVQEENKKRLKVRWQHLPHPKGFMGNKHSDEVKERISASCKEASKHRTYNPPRAVLQFDLYGNYVGRFESITDAAKAVGGGASNIKYAADGKFKKAYNYVWKWGEYGN